VLVVEEKGGGAGGDRQTIAVHLGLSAKLMLQKT
jgi:urease accessory protein UreH